MLIGVVLLILLTEIFIRTAGNLTGYMEYLIASIIVGLIAGKSILNGMFNGVISTLIGGITVLIIEIFLLEGNFDVTSLIIILIFTIFVMFVMGIIGGSIGSFLKISLFKNFTDDIESFQSSYTNHPDKQDRVLKCKSCGGEYILKPDEVPGDFESCSCGGELEFYDAYGRKRPYTTNYPKEKREMSLGTKILILIVVVIFSLPYVLPYLMISIKDYIDPSAGIYLFPIFFIISIAVILILIWYAFIRK